MADKPNRDLPWLLHIFDTDDLFALVNRQLRRIERVFITFHPQSAAAIDATTAQIVRTSVTVERVQR
jgi:hypothetical protein